MKTLLSITLSLLILHLQATIHTVKQDGTGDYTTIQTAIDSPSVLTMDTILVYPGIYYENLIFNKKCWLGSLYMTAGEDEYKYNTIIDGNQNGTVIKITGSGANVREVNGFTIQNGIGFNNAGGGIYLKNANKTKIKNCILINSSAYIGGGIYIKNTQEITLQNLLITKNYARYGGAICNSSSTDIMLNKVSIKNNTALFGGGIFSSNFGTFSFDIENKSSIYSNFGSFGSEIAVGNDNPQPMEFILDTFSINNPDQSFIRDLLWNGQPTNSITIDYSHIFFNPINQDIYVNPISGNNNNSGLTPNDAFKTISYAYKIVASDSLHPNNIYLSPGVYSSTTNGEHFPLPIRSFISLIGDSLGNTILDFENKYIAMGSGNLTKSYQIANITFKNVTGQEFGDNLSDKPIRIELNKSFSFENIYISECQTSEKVLSFFACTDFQLTNIKISNGNNTSFALGEGPVSFPKNGSIENMKIINNTPYGNYDPQPGWPITIVGPYSGYDKYELSNIQITQNISAYDTDFPVSGKSAILIANNVKAKITNITIADNGFTGPYNGTVSALLIDNGAEVELYNSILYGDTINEILISNSQLDVAYSNVEGGEEEIENYGTLNYLAGNQDTIPYFNDTSAYPYQLRWDSPLIDKGTPMYIEGMEPPYIKIIEDKICLIGIYGDSIWLPSTDLAGRPRIKGGRIDMGAYEYQDTATRMRKYYQKDIENFTAKVFPNPFRHNLFIDYEQKEKIKGLDLLIYDVKGYEILSLGNGSILANKGRLIWDGKDEWGQEMPPGTYFLYGIKDGQKLFGKKVVKE